MTILAGAIILSVVLYLIDKNRKWYYVGGFFRFLLGGALALGLFACAILYIEQISNGKANWATTPIAALVALGFGYLWGSAWAPFRKKPHSASQPAQQSKAPADSKR